MSTRKVIGEYDEVVTAYAKRASGPGWGNQPVWVVIRSRLDGAYREIALQPDELTPEIWALYAVSEAAHNAMTGAVKAVLDKQRSRRKAG